MMPITRKAVAVVAGAGLSLSLVACADQTEQVTPATTVAETTAERVAEQGGTDDDTATVTSSTEVTETETTVVDASEQEDYTEETVQIELSDGSTVLVSNEVAAVIEEADDDALAVEEAASGTLITFASQDHIVVSEEVGTQPIVGAIAQTWINDGGLDNPIGLPVAPEERVEGGWVQEFTNGTIAWMHQENGDFGAEIDMN